MDGWARVAMIATLLLLFACCVLLSCRFVADEEGVGVGFLLRMRRTPWEELSALGVLCCNSSRAYLYGMYQQRTDFLRLLHHAPACGDWGFVVPLSRKLENAVLRDCPFEVNILRPAPVPHPRRLRALWHQAVFYTLAMVPPSVIAFLTAGLMLVRAAQCAELAACAAHSLAGFALIAAGVLLLRRALLALITCPCIDEKGVCAGRGLYLDWEDVRFGYVHHIVQGSGMFLLSRPLEEMNSGGAQPVRCLSMPDSSTLLLAYLTYCPHAPQGMRQ